MTLPSVALAHFKTVLGAMQDKRRFHGSSASRVELRRMKARNE